MSYCSHTSCTTLPAPYFFLSNFQLYVPYHKSCHDFIPHFLQHISCFILSCISTCCHSSYPKLPASHILWSLFLSCISCYCCASSFTPPALLHILRDPFTVNLPFDISCLMLPDSNILLLQFLPYAYNVAHEFFPILSDSRLLIFHFLLQTFCCHISCSKCPTFCMPPHFLLL